VERYRYQKAISDLSGNDIGFHGSEPESAVREIRNWFQKLDPTHKFPSANTVWTIYNEFAAEFFEIMKEGKFSEKDVEQMPWLEYFLYVQEWLKGRGYFQGTYP
jgi:hypothetical protein